MTGAQRLLADVNLSTVVFRQNCSEIVLEFLNMTDGGAVGFIVCSGLVLFSYQLSPGDELPQYVGEVDYVPVEGVAVEALLNRLNYGFRSDPPFPKCHHIHIDGGLSVDIVCTAARFGFEGDLKLLD